MMQILLVGGYRGVVMGRHQADAMLRQVMMMIWVVACV